MKSENQQHLQRNLQESRGPEITRFIPPLLDMLKALGGSARPAEAKEAVISKLHISDKELAAQLKNGQSRIENQIAWARYILAKTGHIDSSTRGVWTLTEKGLKETLTPEGALTLIKQVRRFLAGKS